MKKLQNSGGVISWFEDKYADYLLGSTPGWVVLETVDDEATVDPARGEVPRDPKKEAAQALAAAAAPAPIPVPVAPVVEPIEPDVVPALDEEVPAPAKKKPKK